MLEECIATLANRRIGLAEILAEERALQERVAGLISTMEEILRTPLDSRIEECFRMIPREAFAGPSSRRLAYTNNQLHHAKCGVQMLPPLVEVRILEALEL